MKVVLGSSELARPIAEGSEGTVWLARHSSGDRVAVKIVGEEASDRVAAEVRAVAALDHPHIVRILDHGQVPLDAPSEVGPGRRWLAMEFCEATLADRPPTDWPALRALLVQILDALAHAHARGVIHRDLKPANVLWGGARPGYRVSDFGMALRLDPQREAVIHGGTLPYMAPEQFMRRSPMLGPWTDLYGVGCMTWRLVMGRHAFKARSPYEWAMAHNNDALPAFEPVFDVPAGLEPWLRGMLAKAPRARFQLAADAAWVLGRLAGSAPRPVSSASGDIELQPTIRATDTPRVLDSRVPLEEEGRQPRCPAPEDWRSAETAVVGPSPGLSLVGLRPVPLVARRAERDLLWRTLLEVVDHQQSAVVWLEGPAGSGKSHLARWLAHRASETGAATTLLATHAPTAGALDGLPGLVRRALNLDEERGDEAEEDVRRVLEMQHPALAGRAGEVLELANPPAGALTEAGGAMRVALAAELVASFAESRTVILWLDDAVWGERALALAEAVRHLPVLVVLTHRSGTPIDGPTEARWRAWLDASDARQVDIGLLSREAGGVLVEDALGLDPVLAEEVWAHANGNPLFAVQLVGALNERGELHATTGGYALVRGASGVLPADLGALWAERLAALPEPVAMALEVAACLGELVLTAEWARALDNAGLVRPSLDRVFEQGLLRGGPRRWRFVHGMLREALLARMLAGGRSWYRACSDALCRFLGGGQFKDVSGAPYDRLESLYAAWFAVVAPSDRPRVTLRLALLRQGLGRFDGVARVLEPFINDTSVPLDSRLEASTLLASSLKRAGDADASRRWLERGRALAGDDRSRLGRFLVWDIILERHHAGPEAALERAEEALTHPYPLVAELAIRHMYALILSALGRDDEAVLEATGVIERAQAENLLLEEVEARGVRGIAFIRAGRYSRGATEFNAQIAIAQAHGLQATKALPLLNFACALQRVGAADAALDHALAAVVELTRTGAPDYVSAAMFEIAIGLLEQRDLQALQWRDRLDALMPTVRKTQRTDFLRIRLLCARLAGTPDAMALADRALRAFETRPTPARVDVETEAAPVLVAGGRPRAEVVGRLLRLAGESRGEVRARFLHAAWRADPTPSAEETARTALSAVSAPDMHYRTREALAELGLPTPPTAELGVPERVEIPSLSAAAELVDAFIRVVLPSPFGG